MLNFSDQSTVAMTTAFNSVFEIDENYWYTKTLAYYTVLKLKFIMPCKFDFFVTFPCIAKSSISWTMSMKLENPKMPK